MLLKTHLAFAVFAILLFIEHVQNKIIFVIFVLIATMIPDADYSSSNLGKKFVFWPLQFFTKHRGIIHSLFFAILASIILSIYWPVASLGFFVGFSVHLICDSFTKEGVMAFWPSKSRTYGFIRTGGRLEDSLFLFIVLTDIVFSFFVIVM